MACDMSTGASSTGMGELMRGARAGTSRTQGRLIIRGRDNLHKSRQKRISAYALAILVSLARDVVPVVHGLQDVDHYCLSHPLS